jgi:hypothetical protein
MISNPTVTARKSPVIGGFSLAMGRIEKELRKSGDEIGPIELVGGIIASPIVEPMPRPVAERGAGDWWHTIPEAFHVD